MVPRKTLATGVTSFDLSTTVSGNEEEEEDKICVADVDNKHNEWDAGPEPSSTLLASTLAVDGCASRDAHGLQALDACGLPALVPAL